MLPQLLLLFPILASTSLAIQHRNLPRKPHPQARHVQLDERLLPITATTTVVVEMTRTETVWVQPTGQAVFVPVPSTSESVSTSLVGAPSSVDVGAGSSSAVSTSSDVDSSTSLVVDSITSTVLSATSSLESPVPSTTAISTLWSAGSDLSSAHSDVSSTLSVISSTLSIEAIFASSSSAAPSPSTTSKTGSSRPISTSFGSVSNVSASKTSRSSAVPTSSSSSSDIAVTSVSAETLSSSMSAETLWSGSAEAVSATDSIFASATGSLTASPTTDASASSTQSLTASVTESPSASATDSLNATSSITSLSEAAYSSTTISSATASATSAASSLLPIPSTVMCGYYPDWAAYHLSPEQVDWSKFDVMDFAFALPTRVGGLEFTQDDSSDLLKRLVKTGHAAGKRVKLSVGGWTGSLYFSTITGDSDLRATFVKNIRGAYDLYNLDGIDIDWEYPGTGGASGNAVSSQDSANFLKFLTELRAALPTDAIITTATQVWPFADTNGQPMTDVSGFAKVIDWILIMNYDIWGSSSTPGANAPLSDGCGNSSQPLANAYAAISSWTQAGMPANQITLGVPAYGYLQKSKATQLQDRRSYLPHRRGLQERGDYVTIQNEDGGDSDGQLMFWELVNQGALSLSSSGTYSGAGGFKRDWDSCSSTPFLRSSKSGQIVTYDDPESMSLKGQFAAQAGLRGCNVFSVDGDYTSGSWPLTDAVRSGLGL